MDENGFLFFYEDEKFILHTNLIFDASVSRSLFIILLFQHVHSEFQIFELQFFVLMCVSCGMKPVEFLLFSILGLSSFKTLNF